MALDTTNILFPKVSLLRVQCAQELYLRCNIFPKASYCLILRKPMKIYYK